MEIQTSSTSDADLAHQHWFDARNYVRRIHFKSSDRIHADHFLFAHRILEINENARFISKKLAADVLRIYGAFESAHKDGTLTLVGHHSYIETVLALTVDELVAAGRFTEVGYLIFDEATPVEICTNHLILVLPIDITLQRSFAFRKKVRNGLKNGDDCIIPTTISIFLITDGEQNGPALHAGEIDLEKFGWKSVNLEERVIAFTDNTEIEGLRHKDMTVKYLYYYKSKLFNALDCKLCLPENRTEYYKEEPLLTFDDKTLLPSIIFKVPNRNRESGEADPWQRLFSDTGDNIELNADCFVNGHTKFNTTCFIHWIDHEKFFLLNREGIGIWMKKVSAQVMKLIENKKEIYIMTSGRYHKSAFLTMLNKEVFSNRATIINYNNRANLNENFIDFYYPLLGDVEDKIFFYSDDIIDNETNFLELYSMMDKATKRYAMINGNQSLPVRFSFAAVFTVIDRMSDYSRLEFQNVNGLQHFFRYHKISIPALGIQQLGCQLCNKELRYGLLEKESMLDFLKGYYQKKKEKIRIKDGRDNASRKDVEKSYGKKEYFRFIDEGRIARQIIHTGGNDFTETLRLIDEEAEVLRGLIERGFDEKYLQALVTDQLSKVIISEDSIAIAEYAKSAEDLNMVKEYIQHQLFPRPDDNFDQYGKEDYSRLMEKIFLIVMANKRIREHIRFFPEEKKVTIEKKIKKMVIKVLGFPPFSLYKSVNIFIFRYAVIELQKRIDNLNESGNGKLNFTDFLSLKFYMNRSVLLHSNFLLRFDTLSGIEKIFNRNDGKIERRVKLYNSAIDIIKRSTVLGEKNAVKREKIVSLLLRNMEYRVTRIESFNYFIVALIKDLTYRNYSATIVLEKSLNRFSAQYLAESKNLKDRDFLYLWRLLKLENTFLLGKFIDDFIGKLSSWPKGYDRVEGAAEEAFRNDLFYELRQNGYQLNEFLDEHSPTFDAKARSLLDMISLKHLLTKNKQEKDLSTIIHSYFIKILKLENESSTFSFFVDVRSNEKEAGFAVENVYSQVGATPKYTRIDEDGLIANVLNGISLTEDGYSPQSFIELIKENGNYYSVRKNYYKNVTGSNTGDGANARPTIDFVRCFEKDRGIGFYKANDNYFLIFRLSTLENSKAGKAVFIISTSRPAPQFLEPDYLRLLLLLRPSLNDYIDLKYANDYFWRRMQIEENSVMLSSTKHGLKRYLMAFERMLERSEADFKKAGSYTEDNEERYREFFFIFQLFKRQVYKSFQLSEENSASNSVVGGKTDLITIDDLQDNIRKWTRYFFGNSIIGGPRIDDGKYEIYFEVSDVPGNLFGLNSSIRFIVIPEIILNIKQRNAFGLDDNKNLIIEWKFFLKEYEGRTHMEVVVENTMSLNSERLVRGEHPPEIKEGKGLYLCSVELNKNIRIDKRDQSPNPRFENRLTFCTIFHFEIDIV